MSRHTFISRLRRELPALRQLDPGASRTFSIQAHFGEYQMEVGPEYALAECRRRHLRPHSRPIRLHGHIDHLFVEDGRVTPLLQKKTVNQQLRATMILNDIRVEIHDPDGDGSLVRMHREQVPPIQCGHTINLAGDAGHDHLQGLQQNGTLTRSAYQIIQEDILKILRQVRRQQGDTKAS